MLDLRAMVADEAARTGALVNGDVVRVLGDRRMLARLVRNLLDNARTHGGGTEVRASIEAAPDAIVLVVEDRGPGVPEGERERIFEPFVRQARPA